MLSYYVSSYYYACKQLVAESGRKNKRSAARAIAQYLNSKKSPNWPKITISDVYDSLVLFTSKQIALYGVGRFRFILY